MLILERLCHGVSGGKIHITATFPRAKGRSTRLTRVRRICRCNAGVQRAPACSQSLLALRDWRRPQRIASMHALKHTSCRKRLPGAARLFASSAAAASSSADAPVMNRYSRTVTQPKTQGASQARHE
jgi:hypothetical protein